MTLSSLPLISIETHFAVDSSGFSTSVFGRWRNQKYGGQTDSREWVKANVLCGKETNVVVSAMISRWWANDSPYLVPLLNRAAKHFRIEEVAADKAYLSHRNVEAVGKLGGQPFIPFKTNTVQPPEDGSMWSWMYHFFALNREVFLKHYNQRENVEACFSMVKRKFGGSVRSKSFQGQANEVLCKLVCQNICVVIVAMFELGIRPDFCAALDRTVGVVEWDSLSAG